MRWLYIGSLALIAAVTLLGLLMSWWLANWSAGALAGIADLNRQRARVGTLGVRLVCERTDPLDDSRTRETFHSAPERVIPWPSSPLWEAGHALWAEVDLIAGKTNRTHQIVGIKT